MKMTVEHYLILKNSIKALDRNNITRHVQDVIIQDKFKDLHKRIRFDLLASLSNRNDLWDMFYKYLNDVHVDTALKSIMKELGLNELVDRLLVNKQQWLPI